VVFDVGQQLIPLSRLFASQKVAACEIFLAYSKIASSTSKGLALTPGPGDVGWTDEHSQDLYYSGQVPRNEENVPVPKS